MRNQLIQIANNLAECIDNWDMSEEAVAAIRAEIDALNAEIDTLPDEKYPTAWVCTDRDIGQYGRQLGDTQYEFREPDKMFSVFDLLAYKQNEKESIINAYGYTFLSGENKNPSLQNIHEVYGEKADWIVAECIYETY